MSNRLLYSSKNAIRCSPLRSFKSNDAAFRFGCWFAATQGNQKAARFCEEAGIVVIRATADVQPIGRDVASISKVLTNLTAYFVGEGAAPTASQPVLTSLSLV